MMVKQSISFLTFVRNDTDQFPGDVIGSATDRVFAHLGRFYRVPPFIQRESDT
jgi:hypothetical protein